MSQALQSYAWIALGCALGGMLRYFAYGFAARVAGETFPWGTLFVNVAGSAFIGFFAGLTGPEGRLLVSPHARQFVMTGICGGFTTFSTFSLETLRLAQDGDWGKAGWNSAASLALCLAGVWAGHVAAQAINRR